MNERQTRRRFLATIGVGGAAVAGCASDGEPPDATPTSEQAGTGSDASTATPPESPGNTDTPEEERWSVKPIEHDKLVGTHYYLWYEQTRDWQNWLRKVPDEPVLGEYNSADRDVINQHIKWAREHGINWFNVSWTGPEGSANDYQDDILKNEFLEAELGDRMGFSALYESNIRLETARLRGKGAIDFSDEATRETLREDFEYLEETYFDEPTYVTMDGRPVIYFYATHAFDGDVTGAFQEAKDAIDSDPYLVSEILSSDPWFVGRTHAGWMAAFDAINSYNPVPSNVESHEEFVDVAAHNTIREALQADDIGLDYIPALAPGFDNTLIADEHGYAVDRDPDAFRELSRRSMEWLDPDIDAVLITSFNEWPEYTAVEPAESFGTTYLEIVESELAGGQPRPIDPGAYDTVRLGFDRTVSPDGSDRELALVGTEMALYDVDGSQLATYDIGVVVEEPYILEGAYGTESDPGSAWDSWRWFGGPTGRTGVAFDPSVGTPATLEWVGAAVEDGIEADVYVNGERTDHVTFDGGLQTYTVSLQPEV